MPFPERSQASCRGPDRFVNRPFVWQAHPQSIQGLIERLIKGVGQAGIDGLDKHLFLLRF